MPRRPSPLPSELPDTFATADALALGVPKQRLLAQDLNRTFRGARRRTSAVGGEPVQTWWEQRSLDVRSAVEDYRPVMEPHFFLCGPTAAEYWEIPLPPYIDARLHVGTFRPRTAPRRPGIRGRQFTPGFVRVVHRDGIRMTDAASTWATLGESLRLDDLVAATDRVLRIPRHPGGFRVVTEQALAPRSELERLAERKGRPGAPALRSALELARTGSSSPPETRIRLILTEFGLPEPELDHDVYDAAGRFLGCSELAYPDLRVSRSSMRATGI